MQVFRLGTKGKAETSTSQTEEAIRSYERMKLSDGPVSLRIIRSSFQLVVEQFL